MSELESNPPDDEKKPISSIFDPSSYHLNGDYFENQVSGMQTSFAWLPFLPAPSPGQ